MRRRAGGLALSVAITLAIAAAPSLVAAQSPFDLLRHDVENGCGSEETNVPDNSALVSVVFGGPTALMALPELVRWLADPENRSHFTGACNLHDRCYGTLGVHRSECELALLGDLTAACRDAYLTPEWDWWDWASLGTTWVLDTVWEAAAYVPCVSVASEAMYAGVGIFGEGPFTEAQADARIAATCSPSHPQATFGGLYLSEEGVRRAWDTGCDISDLAFGDGRWAGVGQEGAATNQRLKSYSSPEAILPDWTSLAAQGYQLTSLEYGDGEWMAVFTTDTGITGQENRNTSDFSSLADGFRQAATDGYAVTEVEYGDGRWVMYASAGTPITAQSWETEVSNSDLAAVIRRHWDEGFELTNMEWDDDQEGWFLLFSKGMPWADSGYAFNDTYHETRVGMDDDAAVGRRLQDLEYGGGIWLAAWYLPATPPPDTGTTSTTSTTTSPTVSVPNVVDRTEEEARRILANSGFAVTLGTSHLRISTSPSDTALAAVVDHKVFYQDPPAGTQAARGSTVRIQLLEWRVQVPDWVGALPSQVVADAEAMRLNLNPSQVEMLPVGDPLVGRVASVSPPPGTVVLPFSTVVVKIGVAAGVAVPSGSGCSPPGDTLPDGEWFGFVENIDTVGEQFDLILDLACYFDGAQADLAAAADGHPIPLEFYPYIRNQNPKVFDITVSGGATVDDYLMGNVSFWDWVADMPSDNGCSPDTGYRACPLWVRVQGGHAVLLYGLLPEWSGDGRGS